MTELPRRYRWTSTYIAVVVTVLLIVWLAECMGD